MGRYNPHSPQIIGDEWVPIRQADYLPDDVTERGYTFSTDHSVVPTTGSFYVAETAESQALRTFDGITAVYPSGTEDLTGPIRSVIIPCDGVTLTGSGIVGTVPDLVNASDSLFLTIQQATPSPRAGLNFDTAAYATELAGKRILEVRFLYEASGLPDSLAAMFVRLARASNVSGASLDLSNGLPGTAIVPDPFGGTDFIKDGIIRHISLTDMNVFHTAGSSFGGNNEPYAYPWRQEELALLDASAAAANRLIIQLDGSNVRDFGVVSIYVGYAALQVIYCEERRVKYGALHTTGSGSGVAYVGSNFVPLRGTDFTVTGSLAPGEYTVTQSRRKLDFSIFGQPPTLRALRQLYELPPQRGITVNKSLLVGNEFTSVTGNVLPHITLHHSGGIVTGVHAYGTQIQAPVYAGFVADQEIEDDPVGTSKTYPQVRFYARRFGDTTIPLRLADLATGLSTVSITPAAFDALPEIVDGWKEVTLRFATPPSFATAAGDIDWRWTATNEQASSQWQILAADGPSATGTHATSTATYYAPQGNTVTLTWKGPNQSLSTDDPLTDATLIFSQDPPTITGFTIGTCSQTVTGIGQECGSIPACIPTGIWGNQLSWTPIAVVQDAFTRTVASGWGSAVIGGAYTNTGGAAADYSVNGTRGVHSHSATNTPHRSTLGSIADVDITVQVFPLRTATGAPIQMDIIARYADSSNHYLGGALFNTNNTITAIISEVVAGTEATIASTIPGALLYQATSTIGLRFQIVGSTLRLKVWNEDVADEPVNWTIETTDSSLSAAGAIGLRSRFNTGNTNTLPATVEFDNLFAIPYTFADSSLQIQRRDSIDDWATIMDTETLSVTGFCDFEARAGVSSDYRMRVCNVLDFCGAWVTGAATLTTPGVQGVTSANSVLIFTSNESPASSLAYVMQWEGTPIETFAFPEADTVQLQRMFGKDFFTAFRPLERGGETFRRTILVQAAAISLESLANFRSLRDLAWADLPYVCVRDELGNRWYATVLVPTGDVRRNRTLYLAQIEVSEVTNTPSPVDPGT